MKTSKATVNIYDYGKKPSNYFKMRIKISNILEIVILIVVLVIISFCIFKYTNKDKIKEIDKKIIMSIELMQTAVEDDKFASDYLLTIFPDNSGIVSSNGYINNDIGASYKDFEAGYIIMYKDGTYKFELQDDGYCATKDIKDKSYKLLIFKKCSSEKFDYLKK